MVDGGSGTEKITPLKKSSPKGLSPSKRKKIDKTTPPAFHTGGIQARHPLTCIFM